ncbi:MAG TPA: DUF805 domain-containing protein [SAR86 cluster bacterium]|nr:DUF805 domain-containing protein [SAR86 cluster bacterium]|tara:strand:- start:893 stop:1345 length:453 start_codon:yes stop_codon:yes gene_type:complete
MSFFDAVISAFRKYFDFSGRASRSEFWWFFLFCVLLYLLTISLSVREISQINNMNPQELITQFMMSWFGVAMVLTFIPSISISVRRFHDINMSGWWYAGLQILPSVLAQLMSIFSLISFMALMVYLYFMCMKGGIENKYGANPLNQEEEY